MEIKSWKQMVEDYGESTATLVLRLLALVPEVWETRPVSIEISIKTLGQEYTIPFEVFCKDYWRDVQARAAEIAQKMLRRELQEIEAIVSDRIDNLIKRDNLQ
jgi:hypothetical protein